MITFYSWVLLKIHFCLDKTILYYFFINFEMFVLLSMLNGVCNDVKSPNKPIHSYISFVSNHSWLRSAAAVAYDLRSHSAINNTQYYNISYAFLWRNAIVSFFFFLLTYSVSFIILFYSYNSVFYRYVQLFSTTTPTRRVHSIVIFVCRNE